MPIYGIIIFVIVVVCVVIAWIILSRNMDNKKTKEKMDNLKKMLILVVVFLIYGCGGSDPTAIAPSISVADPTNFNGSYVLRDESCIFTPPNKFNITQNGTSAAFTITDNGGDAGIHDGEVFPDGTIDTTKNPAVINSNSLGCSGFFITTQTIATNEEHIADITIQSGDLLLVCDGDNSQTGVCTLSYSHSN